MILSLERLDNILDDKMMHEIRKNVWLQIVPLLDKAKVVWSDYRFDLNKIKPHDLMFFIKIQIPPQKQRLKHGEKKKLIGTDIFKDLVEFRL